MMSLDVFTGIFFAALGVETAIRAPLDKQRRQTKRRERRFTTQERVLLGLLSPGELVFPILYALGLLGFADYGLPTWAAWLGAAVIVGAVLVFWQAHAELGGNWSPTLRYSKSTRSSRAASTA